MQHSSNYATIVERFQRLFDIQIPLANMTLGSWRPVTAEGKQTILNSILQCMNPETEDLKTGIVALEHLHIMPTSHVNHVLKSEDDDEVNSPENLTSESDAKKIKNWTILDGNHRREVFLELEL